MDYKTNEKPLVVIFGRTNVGKSTLFNSLTERSQALVSRVAGTTRDTNLGTVNWQGNEFTVADTGGIIDTKLLSKPPTKKKKPIADNKITINDINIKVQDQARDYLTRADLILFLVDTRDGLLPQDKEMAMALKKYKLNTKKIILVANKADNPRLRKEIAIFNKLSLGEPIPISATSGSGTGDLLDIVIKKLPKIQGAHRVRSSQRVKNAQQPQSDREIKDPIEEKQSEINVCILGKPNVGKSSLVNAIIGEERIIVSPIPHTTREPQDTLVNYKNKRIKYIDTAGISRQGQKNARHKKTKNALEKLSIRKSLSVLRRAHIALLVVDLKEGLTHQECKLIEEIINAQVSLIIVANKWDLIEERDTKFYKDEIYTSLPFARWAPIQFTSALTGEKVLKLNDLILEIAEARETGISDNALTKLLGRIVKKHAPAKSKGTKHPYVFELKQININPPKFLIRIGAKDTLHFSYVRFIENRIREKFGFLGTPLKMIVEKNPLIHGKHEERKLKTTKCPQGKNKK